eukprot:SAG11_NODE_2358_length_3465_cov_17.170478_3_plen_63_part_00
MFSPHNQKKITITITFMWAQIACITTILWLEASSKNDHAITSEPQMWKSACGLVVKHGTIAT